jgi:hypothetical protein
MAKEELVNKVSAVHEALKNLNEHWGQLDWSVVPEVIVERYPFYDDIDDMTKKIKEWLDLIIKS